VDLENVHNTRSDAASKLRAEALAEFVSSWEAEHRVLTAEEVARAERELGLAAGDTAA
jgi:hypothetical protein